MRAECSDCDTGESVQSEANDTLALVQSEMRSWAERSGKIRGPEHITWHSMKQRCTNPNATSWNAYGGRGISVSPLWVNDFQAFLRDMGPRPYGTTIDRIDPNGNYEPGNCRWARKGIQSSNKRPRRRTGGSPTSPLTETQFLTLVACTEWITSRGFAPTIREVCKVRGFNSTNAATDALRS